MRDKAVVLVALALTPNTLAAAEVSARAKKLMVMMNAAARSSPPSRHS